MTFTIANLLQTEISLPCSLYTYEDDDQEANEQQEASSEPQVPFLHSYNQEKTAPPVVGGNYWFLQQYNVINVVDLNEENVNSTLARSVATLRAQEFDEQEEDSNTVLPEEEEEESAGDLVASYELLNGIDTFRCSDWLPESLINNIQTFVQQEQQNNPHLSIKRGRSLVIHHHDAQETVPVHTPDYALQNETLFIFLFSHEMDSVLTLMIEPGNRHPRPICRVATSLRLTYPCGILTEVEYSTLPLNAEQLEQKHEARQSPHSPESERHLSFVLFGGNKSSERWDALHLIDVSDYPYSVRCTDMSHVSNGVIASRRETQAVQRDENRIIYGYGSGFDPISQDQFSTLSQNEEQHNKPSVYFDDLYELDLRIWKWKQIGMLGTHRPTGRSGASMCMHSSQDFLILSGGYNSSVRFMNDIWILNLRADQWVKVIPDFGQYSLTLDTMGYHPSIVHNNSLWIANIEELVHISLPEYRSPLQTQLMQHWKNQKFSDCVVVTTE